MGPGRIRSWRTDILIYRWVPFLRWRAPESKIGESGAGGRRGGGRRGKVSARGSGGGYGGEKSDGASDAESGDGSDDKQQRVRLSR
mmetsp:Transcript_15049/g.30048  ORF Transcript_15049/g.30048 Transcript_15049/m.30048 type:complete len:86 (+) Transcript_15049:213-470(+)